MCKVLNVALVLAYVFVTIMLVIVLLAVFGVRMTNGVRWMMMIGWLAVCFGGVFLMERMGLYVGHRCRRPISSEEERLSGLMNDVRKRMASGGMQVTGPEMRFFILSAPEKRDGSWGIRTILISSSTLKLASDEELRGILAHELGHLRDGDRVWEAAYFCCGALALGFRLGCRLIRLAFRINIVAGFLLLGSLLPVLLSLWLFFLVDVIIRLLKRGLAKLADYRQDDFAITIGCGKGLRDWLEKTGLSANVSRIRRLEKML